MTKETRDEMLTYIEELLKGILIRKTCILPILFTIFATLKLTGNITWSWWWVTAPLWGGVVLFFSILIFVILLVFFAYLLSN